MSNDHSDNSTNSLSRLLSAIFINSGIVIFEIAFGVVTGSMALVSDAVHNLSDISAMILGFWSEKVAKKPATNQKTFGYKKIEFITAFANSIFLSVTIAFILYEAVTRLWSPIEVQSNTMFFVAVIALIGNSVATFILQKTADQNFNLKAVWLHSLQDALISLGVVVAAIIIYFTEWNIIDPIISIMICIFIAREIYKIISQAINALLDSVPNDIDFELVKQDILKIENVEKVTDLHIWQTGSEDRFLSTHIIIKEMAGTERIKILAKIMSLLKETYHIKHPTLQMVSEQEIKEIELKCDHCN